LSFFKSPLETWERIWHFLKMRFIERLRSWHHVRRSGWDEESR
jgi:hypothetical protein